MCIIQNSDGKSYISAKIEAVKHLHAFLLIIAELVELLMSQKYAPVATFC